MMHPDELERLTARRLRQLPTPRAPRTLLPRVMAAMELLSSRPWYARTWFTWPLAGQLLSAGVVLSIVIGYMAWLSPAVQIAVDDSVARVTTQLLAPFSGLIEQGQKVSFAARVVWQSALQTVVLILFVLVLLMFAACAAFGVALDRVALGGASRP
jgi:hypothetical protein